MHSLLYGPALTSIMTTGKAIPLTIQIFDSKVMSLLFNILSRCHTSSSKEQASFNFVAAATAHSDLRAQGGKKICHFSLFCPFICHEVMEPVKGFGVVNKAKVDVFLELLLFQRSSEC